MNESVIKQDTAVLFLHIPKTAGLTMFDILNREYGRTNIYTFPGGRERLEKSINKFISFPENKKRKYRLLRGHFSFGLHRSMPGPCTYITILRDPVKRVASHYRYVKHTEKHALHQQIVTEKMDLASYVTSGINPEMDNGQTRLLAGLNDNEIPFGQCGREFFELACHNLDRFFSVAGLTERFDETLMLLRHVLRWKSLPFYTRQNVSPQQTPISKNNQQIIEEFNQLDLQLYAYATHKFANTLKIISPNDLRHFQQLNRLYQPYGKFLSISRAAAHRFKRSFIPGGQE